MSAAVKAPPTGPVIKAPAPKKAPAPMKMIQPSQTGFLFICNDQTYQECIDRLLFGLPRGKLNEMKRHIKMAGNKDSAPATWLYLFNPQRSLLYGVYEAVSEPSLDIERASPAGIAWHSVALRGIAWRCVALRGIAWR